MIERLKQFFINLYIKLFTSSSSSPASPEEVTDASKPVQAGVMGEVEKLQEELNKLTTGYDAELYKHERQLKELQREHEKLYRNYSEVFKRFRDKTTTESKVNEAKKKMQPLEEKINKIRDEINTISEYKKDDVLNLNNNIQSQKDEFIDANIKELDAINDELLHMKLQYLEKLHQYRTSYKKSSQLEMDLMQKLNQLGLEYKADISKQVHQQLDKTVSFTINETEVNNILAGGSVPYDLLKKVKTNAEQTTE